MPPFCISLENLQSDPLKPKLCTPQSSLNFSTFNSSKGQTCHSNLLRMTVFFLTTSTRPVEAKIKTDFQTQEQRSIGGARKYLSTTRPLAILAVDAGLLGNTYEQGRLQKELASYVGIGGTLIMACLFSSFSRPPQLDAFYTRIDLPWRVGDYNRTTFYRNPAFKPIFIPQLYTSLEDSYSMKAVHLQHITPAARVYVPEASSRTQSMVFAQRSTCNKARRYLHRMAKAILSISEM